MEEPKADAVLEELESKLKSLEAESSRINSGYKKSLPDPLKNTCPQCNIDRGYKCVTPQGKSRHIHKSREDLARDETKKLGIKLGLDHREIGEELVSVRSSIYHHKALADANAKAAAFMSELELFGDSQAVTIEHDGPGCYEVVSVTNINGLCPFNKIHGKIAITLMLKAGINVTLNKKRESPQSHKLGRWVAIGHGNGRLV